MCVIRFGGHRLLVRKETYINTLGGASVELGDNTGLMMKSSLRLSSML